MDGPAAWNDLVAATAASHFPEVGCFAVVFADDPECLGWSLEFAGSDDEHDEQDRDLGQDTYSVALSGGATIYGGVLRWTASNNVVSIVFMPEAAHELGVPTVVRFALDFEGAELRRVHDGLKRILGQCD